VPLEPRSHSPRRTLRAQLLLGFAVSIAVPLPILLGFGAFQAVRSRAAAEDRLQEAARSVSSQVGGYVQGHLGAITAVAAALSPAGTLNVGNLNLALARFHAAFPGFITMLFADSSGRVVAAHPLVSASGDSILSQGLSVADREYFRHPMATGAAFLSGAFRGRGFGADPIVALSAPVAGARGGFAGVVEGSLDLTRFDRFQSDFAQLEGARVLVLDHRGVVVFASTASPHQPLDSLHGPEVAGGSGETHEVAAQDSAGSDIRLMVARAATPAGWSILVEQPVSVLTRETRRFFWSLFLAVVAAMAVSLLVARRLAFAATRPVEDLVRAVRDFGLTGSAARGPDIGPDTLAEVAQLVGQFDVMSHQVGKVLSGLLPICAGCKKIRDDRGGWVPVESYIRERSDAQFSHGLCPDCSRRYMRDLDEAER
jgi:hypothetical protein